MQLVHVIIEGSELSGTPSQEFNRQLQEAERPDQLTLLRDITFELAAPAMELRRQRENYKASSPDILCSRNILIHARRCG